jgi:ubiquinol-cytochrome c reductase cytochrome b subunit
MGITFWLVLTVSGANDVISSVFDISLNATTWIGRIGILVLPPLAYWLTHRACLGLQQHDRQVLAHGVETGIIRRRPDGGFMEVHQPLGPTDPHGHGELDYTGAPVPKKMNRLGALGPAVRGFFGPLEKADGRPPAQRPTPDGHEDGGADDQPRPRHPADADQSR